LLTSKNKLLIRWLIGAVLAIDLVLLVVNWRLNAQPATPRVELNLLRKQHALLAADVARAQQIRNEMPRIEQQSETFFNQNLQPAGTGYSSVVSDFGTLTRDAGLQAEHISFRQHPADKRGVVEVEISSVVNGDYPSVVRFINGLEHSDNFYVLEGLELAAGSAGELRLNLQLRTYFKT
jgi:Tfp pilus assembly protein PilO